MYIVNSVCATEIRAELRQAGATRLPKCVIIQVLSELQAFKLVICVSLLACMRHKYIQSTTISLYYTTTCIWCNKKDEPASKLSSQSFK